jgi:hypothetical protein
VLLCVVVLCVVAIKMVGSSWDGGNDCGLY